jgi:hypothetical protein
MVQGTTKYARRAVSEVTENINQPVRDDEMRFVRLFSTCIPRSG